MNQPELILRTLDANLAGPAKLILFGRAALALGYSGPHAAFEATMDVDAILPEVEMSEIEADESFWSAIERTNNELLPTGLYITHLFTDSQIILRPFWLDRMVRIPLLNLRFLTLFRPSTEDLILTKMMRIDPQDRSDIEFLLQNINLDTSRLDELIAIARVPDILEIQEAFDQNSVWLRSLVSNG